MKTDFRSIDNYAKISAPKSFHLLCITFFFLSNINSETSNLKMMTENSGDFVAKQFTNSAE